MKVDSFHIKQNQDYLDQLNRSQKDHIAKREHEIDQIKKIYKAKEDDQKIQSEVNLSDLRERDQARIAESANLGQERLKRIKKNFLETEDRLLKQEGLIKGHHQEKITDANLQFDDKYKEAFARAEEKSRNLNANFNDSTKEIQEKTNREILALRNDTKRKIDQLEFDQEQKIRAKSEQGSSLLQRRELEQVRLRNQLESEHARELGQIDKDGIRELETRKRIHTDQLSAQKSTNQESLKSTKEAFDQKYQTMIEEHAQVMSSLEKKFDREINDLKESRTTIQEKVDLKTQDDFYQVEKLPHQLEETKEGYIVKISTPEHEKSNYILSTDKRSVRLSFTRRHQERIDTEQGEVHKSSRSEAISKEFQVQEIVDASSITQKWDNGVLSFFLKKA